jgi:MoaA/NifB/PqqE/SkfB family radical SAM enzyme
MASMTRTIEIGLTVPKEDKSYIKRLNGEIARLFLNALPLTLKDPGLFSFMAKSLVNQQHAAALRASWEKRGTHVPAFMIASVTHRCNLRCKGCYAWAQHALPEMEMEMSAGKLRQTIKEAKELGVSIVLLAGGEPLTRPEILEITRDYPEIIFPLFTNGTMITEEVVRLFKAQRNIIPVLSLEGRRAETDARRGEGTYYRVIKAMEMMKREGIFFGTSITLTRNNFMAATDEFLVKKLIHTGARLFFFIDYTPVEKGTENLILTPGQRKVEAWTVQRFREELPALFIAFPGDEEMYGGCLAAGRGFVHVSPEGWVEPCPATPYSDSNLREMSLREALESPMLKAIRESGADLHETSGGCALFDKQEWLKSLIAN